MMDALEYIKNRRSVRSFSDKKIPDETLNSIIEAALNTPSPKNNQPWKIKIIQDNNVIKNISELMKNSSWVKNAPYIIIVYLNKKCSFHYLKDIQACGAFMQTILLAANHYNIGSCWVGEICSNGDKINSIVDIKDDSLELMGLIALGIKNSKVFTPYKKSKSDIIL